MISVPDRVGAAGPRTDRGAPRDPFVLYDRPEVAERYYAQVGDDACEVRLDLQDVHCASCVWRIEQRLETLHGIARVDVTPLSGRAVIALRPTVLGLGDLLRALDELGFAPTVVAPDAPNVDPALRERRMALARLGVAGLGMMQVMMYSLGQYLGAFQGIDPAIDRLLGLVSLLVATPVVLFAGQPFFDSAWRGLRRGAPGMDVPVALAIGLAFTWSVWIMLGPSALVPAAAHTYFDSVVMLIFLLLLGRYVEMGVRHRAGERREALARLLPDAVTLIHPDGTESPLERAALRVGDRVRVRPGEAIPADGAVVAGGGEVDEAMLTGESVPQMRAPGSTVFGGTGLLNGSVDIEVRAVGEQATLARIERLMDKAEAERPPLASLADRVARHFVMALLAIAVVVGAVWWHIDPARVLPVVLSVLVVTCPCALSLATPAALAAATSALASRGLLVTRTSAIESLAQVDTVIFDKTGTLTRATPALQQVVRIDDAFASDEEALTLAAALEAHSAHPLAEPFRRWRDGRQSDEVRSVVGAGVEARVDGRLLRIGRADFVSALTPQLPMPSLQGELEHPGGTQIWLGDEAGARACFVLTDAVREDAGELVRALEDRYLAPMIASGDGAGAVESVARGLAVGQVYSRMSPKDKLGLVQRLQGEGKRTLMVGDGINDAPVLAGADVSVALASGTDLAQVSADMVLLGDALTPLAQAVDHARRTVRLIRQNLSWAILYNLTALPLAAMGLVPPWLAAIGMSLSSLVVVGNALRLRRLPAA
ncbi:MAG: cation-translocating P-type ATPase [Pseudomonadota bacterium]